VTVLRFEYVDRTCATADLDLAALVIDEKIIGVAASFGANNQRAVVGAMHAELGWVFGARLEGAAAPGPRLKGSADEVLFFT
jgi:hypothetical protein